jgi:hypothetical protein
MKNHHLLFITMCFFFFQSCNKDEVESDIKQGLKTKTNENIIACGVTNPGKNLAWLASIIEKAQEDTTGNYLGVIWLENYNGQDVFVTNMMLGSGGLAYHIFDCQGNPLYIDNSEKESFFKNLKKDTVIFVYPDDYPL